MWAYLLPAEPVDQLLHWLQLVFSDALDSLLLLLLSHVLQPCRWSEDCTLQSNKGDEIMILEDAVNL